MTVDSRPILQSMHWMLSCPKRPHESTFIDSSGQSMLPCLMKVSRHYRNRRLFLCVEAHDAFLFVSVVPRFRAFLEKLQVAEWKLSLIIKAQLFIIVKPWCLCTVVSRRAALSILHVYTSPFTFYVYINIVSGSSVNRFGTELFVQTITGRTFISLSLCDHL
jgi:hypothetical protein